MRASSSSSLEASHDDAFDEAADAPARSNWIGLISVLGYCAICGLVYLLH